MLRIAFGLGLIVVGLWANWHIWSVTNGAAFAWDVTTWPVLFHNIWVDPLGYAQVIYSLAVVPPVLGVLCLLSIWRRDREPRLASAGEARLGVPKGWRRPEARMAQGEVERQEPDDLATLEVDDIDPADPDRTDLRKADFKGAMRRSKAGLGGLLGRLHGTGGRLVPFVRQIAEDLQEIFGGDLDGLRRMRDRARRADRADIAELAPEGVSGGLGRFFRRSQVEQCGKTATVEATTSMADPDAELLEEVLAWFTVWSQTHRSQRTDTMRRRASELLEALTPAMRNRLSDEHGMRGITILQTLAAATEAGEPAKENGLAEPVPQPSTEDLMEESNRIYAAGAQAKSGPAFSEDERPRTPDLRDAEAPSEGHDLARHVGAWAKSKITTDPEENEDEDDPITRFSRMHATPEGMMAGLEMALDPEVEPAETAAEETAISFGSNVIATEENDGSSFILDGDTASRDDGSETRAAPSAPASSGTPTLISWREKQAANVARRQGETGRVVSEFGPSTSASDTQDGEDVEEAATLNSLMGGIAQRVERVADEELIEAPKGQQDPASTVVPAEEIDAVISAIPPRGFTRLTGSRPDARRRTEQNYIRAGLAALDTRDDFVPALWEALQKVVRYQSMVHAAEHLGEPFPEQFQDPRARADHLFNLVTAIVNIGGQVRPEDREALIALKADTEEARWLKNRRAEKLIERFRRQGAVEPEPVAPGVAAQSRSPADPTGDDVGARDGHEDSVVNGRTREALDARPAETVRAAIGAPSGEVSGEVVSEMTEGEVVGPASGGLAGLVDAPRTAERRPAAGLTEDWIDGVTQLAVESRMAVRRDLRFNPRSEGAAGLSDEDRMIDIVVGRRIAEKNTVLAGERVAVINRIQIPAGKWSLVVRDGSAESGSRCFLETVDGMGEISLRDGSFRLIQRFYRSRGLAVDSWLMVEIDPAAEIFDVGELVDPEEALSACMHALAEAGVRICAWSPEDWAEKIASRVS